MNPTNRTPFALALRVNALHALRINKNVIWNTPVVNQVGKKVDGKASKQSTLQMKIIIEKSNTEISTVPLQTTKILGGFFAYTFCEDKLFLFVFLHMNKK